MASALRVPLGLLLLIFSYSQLHECYVFFERVRFGAPIYERLSSQILRSGLPHT
jgi:hypothetical protein